jgi:hypothetical protein
MAVHVVGAEGGQQRRVVSATPLRIQTQRRQRSDNDDDDDECCDDDGEYVPALATGSSSGSSSTTTTEPDENEEEDEPQPDDSEEEEEEDDASRSSEDGDGDDDSPNDDYDANNISPSRTTRSQQRRRRFFRLIPATHPLKLTWDIITFGLSLWNAYLTHVAIRDRSFDYNRTRFITEVWFAIDIMLNFVTERRVHGTTLTTFQSVSAYYLTTWFVVDVLSLMPGESMFVSPVVERLQKRKRIVVWWNRIKTMGRWTRKLIRDPHVRHASVLYTRRKGVRAASKMVRLLTFYVPKYFMFFRHMKAVVGFRLLRQVRLIRHMFVRREVLNTTTDFSMTTKNHHGRPQQKSQHQERQYFQPVPPKEEEEEDLSVYDEDDDGSPY